jgi:hypothetical protein
MRRLPQKVAILTTRLVSIRRPLNLLLGNNFRDFEGMWGGPENDEHAGRGANLSAIPTRKQGEGQNPQPVVV